MSLLDPNNPRSPFYRVKIDTEEKRRIYRKLLIVKIAILVAILIGLLALASWAWQALVFGIIFAAAWKALEYMLKQRKQNINIRGNQ